MGAATLEGLLIHLEVADQPFRELSQAREPGPEVEEEVTDLDVLLVAMKGVRWVSYIS